MFFILSKTLGILAVPSHVLTLFMLIGLVLLFTRWVRAGQRLLIVCVGSVPCCRGHAGRDRH